MKKRTRSDISPYGTWKCVWCNQIFRTKSELAEHKHQKHTRYDENGNKLIWNKGLTKETCISIAKGSEIYKKNYTDGKIKNAWKGKHLPLEMRKKVSDGVKLAIVEGRANGWQVRAVESYPEKFWKQVLENNNIPYEFNFKVTFTEINISKGGCYFLDFKLPKNIDLEIDGSQHQYRIEADNLRDQRLSSIGYKIYRIKWNEINTEFGKKQMQEKIDAFIKWYNIQ